MTGSARSGGTSLAARVAVVTGAARGIGLATARALAAEGARVALADIDEELAEAGVASIDGALALPVDVADGASFAAMLDAVERRVGPPDVLVNNAGLMWLGRFLEIDERVARRQIDVNLGGVVNGMRLALPGMVSRGRGHVVNVSSAAGRTGVPGENVYSATKHGIVGLTEAVAGELRDTPVQLSVVLPGPVRTELAAGMRPSLALRLVEPEAVARAIVRTLRRPRPEVWVPRSLGWVMASGRLLPRGLRERTGRLLGVDAVATQIDAAARAPYHERAFGASA